MTARKWKICGHSIRSIIFIANGVVWVSAMAAIIGGFIVGLANGTMTLDAAEDDENYAEGDVRWKDVLLTTPATLLIYYGIVMLSTASLGCFAAAGARRCCSISFLIAIILLIIFDLACGIKAFFNPFAMKHFMDTMEKGMDDYATGKGKAIGVIPMNPKDYWDYLQKIGSCCGMVKYTDWRNKTIGTKKYDQSIPDTCCTSDYDVRFCGWRIWAHNEGDYEHYRRNMMKKTGCITIFPEELTTKYNEVAYLAILLGLLLITCLILTVVLLVLIFLKKYRGGQGPEKRPHFRASDPEFGAQVLVDEQPPLWKRRGRRSALKLPIPPEDLNYLINEKGFGSRDQQIAAGQAVHPLQASVLDLSPMNDGPRPIDLTFPRKDPEAQELRTKEQVQPESKPNGNKVGPAPALKGSTAELYRKYNYDGGESGISRFPEAPEPVKPVDTRRKSVA